MFVGWEQGMKIGHSSRADPVLDRTGRWFVLARDHRGERRRDGFCLENILRCHVRPASPACSQ